MSKKEIWKDIKGYENLYQVSNMGEVKRLPKTICNEGLFGGKKCYKCEEKILKAHDNGRGYKIVTLTKKDTRYTAKVHRLVAETFIPNPKNKSQVNHINGIKTDNRAENLEWATPKENAQHAIRMGLISKQDYEKIAKAKQMLEMGVITQEEFVAIKEKIISQI